MKKLFNKLFKKKTKTHFYPTDVWSEIADKYDIKNKLWHLVKTLDSSGVEDIGNGLVLYGEIYGPGIQKNYDYGLKDIEFAGFDVTINNRYVSATYAYHIIKNDLGLPHVPELYFGPWNQEVQDKYTFNNNIDYLRLMILLLVYFDIYSSYLWSTR